MGEGFEFEEPENIPLVAWVATAVLAPIIWVIFLIPAIANRELSARAYRFITGLALLWVAVVVHVVAYPVVITYPLEVLQTILLTLWGAIPTIYWAPWHVSSVVSVAGVGLVASGFWGGERDE